jgi:hypothetical protein
MFNPDFYPTPPEVAATMLDPLDLQGAVILEPSAGSGNLVAECLIRGAARVVACENEPKLRSLLAGGDAARTGRLQIIGEDFLQLQAGDVATVDAIVMNPPFSAGAAHLLHAWRIAPAGCQIVSLLNSCTLTRWHRGDDRRELQPLVDAYGSVQELGECFREAERRTNVEVSLVRLRKPANDDASEFDGFFMGPDDVEAEGQGIIPYNLARDVVNRYVEACKIFNEQLATAARLSTVLDGVYQAQGTGIAVLITENGVPRAANAFRKDLQRQFWTWVIKRMGLERTATSQLQKDLAKFVEQQSHVPFTMRNIYRMLEIVIGTHEQRMDKAVIEVFDEFTKHTKENRWGVEGWVTNEQYLFGKKFIVNDLVKPDWSGSTVSIKSYCGRRTQVEDLIKALCSICGKSYDLMKDPACGYDHLEAGVWQDWGFFRFKVYKKGTGHFEFKDLDDWARLNQRVAKIRGWVLPEQMKRPRPRRKREAAAA